MDPPADETDISITAVA